MLVELGNARFDAAVPGLVEVSGGGRGGDAGIILELDAADTEDVGLIVVGVKLHLVVDSGLVGNVRVGRNLEGWLRVVLRVRIGVGDDSGALRYARDAGVDDGPALGRSGPLLGFAAHGGLKAPATDPLRAVLDQVDL